MIGFCLLFMFGVIGKRCVCKFWCSVRLVKVWWLIG